MEDKFIMALCFDFDAETLWKARGSDFEKPVILSLGKYGSNEGIPRILKMLKREGIPATFFVPGWVIENHKDKVDDIYQEDHEIAHHGYLHKWPDSFSPVEEKEVLIKGIEIIKDNYGEKPVGYRSPAWEFSPHTLSFLIELGFKYSSNMMDADYPYMHFYEGHKTNLMEFPIHWQLDDAAFFLYSLRLVGKSMAIPRLVGELWQEEFDYLYEERKYMALTCHPQVIGRPARMKALENFISHVKKRSDVDFMTLKEARKYFETKL